MSKKCTPLWREAHFQVKMHKAHQCRTTFGSCDVEKVHAVVARSTFPSQNVQNTPLSDNFWKLRDVEKVHAVVARSTFPSENVQNTQVSDHFWKLRDVGKVHAVVARSTFPSQNVQSTPLSDHFWKLRCRKSARRCGAKHISKWKCTKHTSVGPLLEVEMSKKCTPLWREAHFQVKMHKTHHCRTTFGSWDVKKVHAAVARSIFWSQNVKNTRGSDHFWRFICRKSARLFGAKMCEAHFQVKMLKAPGFRIAFGGSDVASLRFTTLHYTTLHYTTLHNTTLHNTTTTTTQLHSTTLHYAPLH